ncbi:MAG: ABC transporter permease [Acidobacteriota bacterium]
MKIPIKYNIRNLRVRWTTTTMTILGIGLVVWASVIAIGLIVGLMAGIGSSADPLNLIVLRKGANSETESYFAKDTATVIATLPGIATGSAGDPLASPEIVIITNTPRRDGTTANLVVRGVTERARDLRPGFRIVEGRDFQPGVREAIASHRIASRFATAGLGESMSLRRGDFKIVGIFETNGGSAESEIWTDAGVLAQDQSRSGSYSSLRLRADDSEALSALEETIAEDERIALKPVRETEYFQKQAQSAGAITGIGMAIALILTVGAMFAAANTMYAAVAARAREIGTLRALGFPRRSILISFILESIVLCFLGGIVGCILALPVNGLSTGTVSWYTFSEVAFSFQINAPVLILGILLATVTGILGGFFPAVRAVRLRIVDALREV